VTRRPGGEPPRLDGPRFDGPRFVAKRDGRRAAFEAAKIKSAVWRAMLAVGDGDEAFADDVAAVVALALRREAQLKGDLEWTPTIEEIQDRVERALVEMGRAAVAKAYILYRDRRARARAAAELEERRTREEAARNERDARDARTHDEAAADADAFDEAPRVQVRRADRTSPWSRGRIAAALVAEADLERELAQEVAHAVEQRVLASGLREVSTALVRALVDHELVARGSIEALRRTEPIALPRHDLARLSSGAAAEVWEPWRRSDVVVGGAAPFDGLARAGSGANDLLATVGGEVLRRYALSDVLDARSAQLHAAGELHVEDLCRPQRFLHLSVPADVLGGEVGLASDAPYAALATMAELLDSTSRGATIESAGPLVRALFENGDALVPWLVALGSVARAAGQRVLLRCDGPVHAAERAALVESLCTERDGLPLPLLVLDVEHVHELLAGGPVPRHALLAALEAQRILVGWHRGDGAPCGLAGARGRGERGLVAVAGAVGLNLPRLARRAGSGGEERFFEELFGLLSCAIEAARSLAHFQERAGPLRRGARETRRLHARTTHALVPIGLGEALAQLCDGEVDPRLGARVLGLVAEAAARFPEPGAPKVELCSFFGAEAARRLAFTDRTAQDAPRSQQAWLFAEMAGRDALVRAYTTGFALGPTAAWRSGECEAELVRTVPSGVLHPAPPRVNSVAPGVAIERFAAARRAALEGERDQRERLGRDVFTQASLRDSPTDELVPAPLRSSLRLVPRTAERTAEPAASPEQP
jgi:transcriptional regulator NrdR family protein